jgi:hypothetical protein
MSTKTTTSSYKIGDKVKTAKGNFGIIEQCIQFVYEEYHRFQHFVPPEEVGKTSPAIYSIKTIFNKNFDFYLSCELCYSENIDFLTEDEIERFENAATRLKPKTLEKVHSFPVDECQLRHELQIAPTDTCLLNFKKIKEFIQQHPKTLTKIFEFLKSYSLFQLLHYEIPHTNITPHGASCSTMYFINKNLELNSENKLLISDFYAVDSDYHLIDLT